MSELISISNIDRVRVLRLNDPSTLNSLSEKLARQLFDALKDAENDPQIGSVVVTGAGHAFCTGGNLREFAEVEEALDDYVRKIMAELYNPLAQFLNDMRTPLVTAVNGPAIGAGMGLALNADFVLMARDAYFTLPFVSRLAVLPDFGITWFLTRTLGYQRALGYVLTGNKLDAETALAEGLAWRVVECEVLDESALKLANQLAELPSGAVDTARQALDSAYHNDLPQQLELERELQAKRFGGAAFREGLAAFAEKRKPDFSAFAD